MTGQSVPLDLGAAGAEMCHVLHILTAQPNAFDGLRSQLAHATVTMISVPTMKADSGALRCSTVDATSSGVPKRPSGIWL